ncbi:TOPRIM nucleotidyl transferase/hydrolase domain-containing protein [Streptomyces sp. NPDC008313]|uniref:TOPRIM nucleotidyl transferase/hydrolase domain-containing protein n=1 Tax=Streptomyces sp. NPDC008313 TaxID=3364826 RepID=UPI0036E62337
MADMGAFRTAVTAWAAGGPGGPARELAARLSVRTAVLLEGASDRAAVDALAARHGRDPAAEGICVLPMGGAMNVGRFARVLGPSGLGLRLTGLCDERERGFYVRALTPAAPAPHSRTASAGLVGSGTAPSGLAGGGTALTGLFVCAADLEDELIRALGVARVTELVEAEGDLRPLRTFLRQPAQRDRPAGQQVRRFLGTKKGRKIHYGRVLVEALEPGRVPAPLAGLLAAL